MKKVLFLFPCILLVGCIAQSVPRTKIVGNVGGKPVSFEMPKDVTLGYLSFTADTNGAVSVTVSNLQTRMNPEVITTTGDAQAKLVQAGIDGAVKIIGALPK